MRSKYNLCKLFGLILLFFNTTASDLEYQNDDFDYSSDERFEIEHDFDYTASIPEKTCDVDNNIYLLGQIFLAEVTQALKSEPDNDLKSRLLYLANDIAEKYVKEASLEFDCKNPNYLSLIVDRSKAEAQEFLSKIEAERLAHREKMKRFVIENYCKLWGIKCPKFK